MSQSNEFHFACPTPGCGHVYRATPQLVGKLILCKECKQKVRVPAGSTVAAGSPRESVRSRAPSARDAQQQLRQSATAHAGSPSRSAAHVPTPRQAPRPASSPVGVEETECPHCRTACRIRPEWRGTTLACPSCARQFVVPAEQGSFTAQPSDETAFCVEDESERAVGTPPLDPYELDSRTAGIADVEVDQGPYLERTTTSPKKKKRRGGSATFSDWGGSAAWGIAAAGTGVLVMFVVALVMPAVAMVAALIGVLVALCGGVWAIVTAFGEGVGCGLAYLFCPFGIYQLYFLVTRWDEMKRPFFLQMAGGLLIAPLLMQFNQEGQGKPFRLPGVNFAQNNQPADASAPGAAPPVPQLVSAPGNTQSVYDQALDEALGIFQEFADALSKITDRTSAASQRFNLTLLAGRWESLETRIKLLPNPSPEEDRRLQQKYESKLRTLDQRLRAEVSRLESLGLFRGDDGIPSMPAFTGLGPRMGGPAGGGIPGGFPVGPQGTVPGRTPGQIPGGIPGGPPSGLPRGGAGGLPGGVPGGPPSGIPGRPGGVPGRPPGLR